jgi:hypothetical protein
VEDHQIEEVHNQLVEQEDQQQELDQEIQLKLRAYQDKEVLGEPGKLQQEGHSQQAVAAAQGRPEQMLHLPGQEEMDWLQRYQDLQSQEVVVEAELLEIFPHLGDLAEAAQDHHYKTYKEAQEMVNQELLIQAVAEDRAELRRELAEMAAPG